MLADSEVNIGPHFRPRLPLLESYHPGWLRITCRQSLKEGLQFHLPPLIAERDDTLFLPVRIISLYRRESAIYFDVQAARFSQDGEELDREEKVVGVTKVKGDGLL